MLVNSGGDDDSSATTKLVELDRRVDHHTTEASTTTTERADAQRRRPRRHPAPTIASFTGPDSVSCTSDTTVQLSWSTENASRTTISIDGAAQPGSFGASATQDLPFPCSGSSHAYLLTAFGANNRTVTQTKAVAVSP